MTPPDPGHNLAGLLKRINARAGDQPQLRPGHWDEGRPDDVEPLLWHLVYSFMMWEAGEPLAAAANFRLHSTVVDYNEMRVCLVDEIRVVLGDQYPLVGERACRLRAALNDIYRREHRVTLTHLPQMGRREARHYLDSLEGIPQFVAARVALLSLDAHGFPLDARLHAPLLRERALPPDMGVEDAAAWCERYFRAGEAAPAYLMLEAWVQAQPDCADDA